MKKTIKIQYHRSINVLKSATIVFDTGNLFSQPNITYLGESPKRTANQKAYENHLPSGQKYWILRKV